MRDGGTKCDRLPNGNRAKLLSKYLCLFPESGKRARLSKLLLQLEPPEGREEMAQAESKSAEHSSNQLGLHVEVQTLTTSIKLASQKLAEKWHPRV